MQQLIITKGLPASGKSTWSRKWVNEAPKERIRVNRDDIRRMLGPYWVPTREDLVTSIEKDSIRTAIVQGFSVVVDATNFKEQWLIDSYNNWKKYTPELQLVIKDFTDVPLETCIYRDSIRHVEERVGESVIRHFYDKYIKK
jgi:tRNA uridine 5-carbamoylmethylation protein Kti12